MILIYYKNAAGMLCGYTYPAKGWTLRQLKEEVERFNIAQGGGCKAYARLVQNRVHKGRKRETAAAAIVPNTRRNYLCSL